MSVMPGRGWASRRARCCLSGMSHVLILCRTARQAESLAFGLIISCIKQHGGGNGKLAGSSKVGE